MQIGIVGLGRMGANMARRLLRGGHDCVVFDMSAKAVEELVHEKATGAASLADLAKKLHKPRAVWLMVPAAVVDQSIASLVPLLEAGDTIIDGGNSYYIDDIRRAKELSEKGIHYVDVGTSGGVWGLERGYCMMIGGEDQSRQRASIRSSGSSHREWETFHERRDGRRSKARQSPAICIAGRTARGISSRWSTTESNTE